MDKIASLVKLLKEITRKFFKIPFVKNILEFNYICIRKLNPDIIKIKEDAEELYTKSWRALLNAPKWKYGPKRVQDVFSEAYNNLNKYVSIQGGRYLDLGCGHKNPYGTSAVMFLNGTRESIGLDVLKADERRSAEALYDTIVECASIPDDWHYSDIPRHEFYENLYQFDIAALKAGDLRRGTKNVPIHYVVSDICENNLESNSIDLMSSRAVLEHFMDFPKAISELFRIMCPAGIAYHHIDLVDHRARRDSKYHYWSFMEEGGDWTERNINLLRYSELREYIIEAGFEIVEYKDSKAEMPKDLRKSLKEQYGILSDEELSITGVSCILKKP